MAQIVRLSDIRRKAKPTFFSRLELNQLLSLYSQQVKRGQWRDYAIGLQDGRALFAIFRHSSEAPLFTIIKSAGNGNAEFTLMAGRLSLARDASLPEVLTRLRRQLRPNAILLDGEGAR